MLSRLFGLIVMLVLLFTILVGCADQRKETSQNIVPNTVVAKKVALLSQAGDEVYQKSILGDFLGARNQIIQMGEMVTHMSFDGVTTIYGVKALADTLVQALYVFNAMAISAEEAMLAAAKIRLATDALSHPNTPIWLQYGKIVKEDITHLEQLINQKNSQFQSINQSFSQLNQHYATVRSAIIINREISEVEKIDSLLVFLREQLFTGKAASNKVKGAIKHLSESMDLIFQNPSAATYLPITVQDPSIRWTLFLGSLIILVLCFTAWRMYWMQDSFILVRREDKSDFL